MDPEHLKDRAAAKALELVRPGMRLGLGTGTTVAWFLKHLAAALADGRMQDIAGVPTSKATERICRESGIPLTSLSDSPQLDLAVDGADEVTPGLDLMKGLGGALLREKMVAAAARSFVVVADASKEVERLGLRSPLPVEVVPFEWRSHVPFLERLGCEPVLRVDPEGRPVVTDNGHYLLDCGFPGGIPAPGEVGRRLADRPGVVEHGLFLGLCTSALVAGESGVRELLRPG